MRSAGSWLCAAFWLTFASGCSLIGIGSQEPEPSQSQPVLPPEAQLVFSYLASLERLHRASPAEQAELVDDARRAAALDPTTSNQLRYALMLGLPGHVASAPQDARNDLGELLAIPERMLPAELALARVIYEDVNARLALESEIQRLAAQVREGGKDAHQELTRRLQTQAAENVRLRQQLDDALAKLEAIAALERSLSERESMPKGAQP